MAMAGDGFEQMVGLAGAAPAVSDFGFEVLSPSSTARAAWARVFAAFAVVVATDFEGVAQLGQVLLRGGGIPKPEEAVQVVANRA